MVLSFALVTGCDKSADEQQKANAAQAEADKKIAEASKEAMTKTTSAQVEADKKIAAAEGDFGKRREDYRHKLQSDLVDLDKKIDLLEANAKAATGKAKTDLGSNLVQLRARRTAFAADVASVESATAVQWDGTKARVDKDWSDLKAAVDKAN
jgi:chromosome segregation ATPase